MRKDPWPEPNGKRERTRRRILLAAEVVFGRSSVERAKIEDVADVAGVSPGTVYLHYGTKEALAIAYLDAVFDLLDADLAALVSEPSPLRRVLAAGDAYVQHVIDFPVASRMASVRAAYPPSEHHGAAAEALDRRMVTTLMGVAGDLKEAMDRGEMPPAPIDEAMIFVWASWHGVATMIARCDHLTLPPETAKRALARGRRIMTQGITFIGDDADEQRKADNATAGDGPAENQRPNHRARSVGARSRGPAETTRP